MALITSSEEANVALNIITSPQIVYLHGDKWTPIRKIKHKIQTCTVLQFRLKQTNTSQHQWITKVTFVSPPQKPVTRDEAVFCHIFKILSQISYNMLSLEHNLKEWFFFSASTKLIGRKETLDIYPTSTVVDRGWGGELEGLSVIKHLPSSMEP